MMPLEQQKLLKDEEKRAIIYVAAGMILMWGLGYIWAVIT